MAGTGMGVPGLKANTWDVCCRAAALVARTGSAEVRTVCFRAPCLSDPALSEMRVQTFCIEDVYCLA